MATWEAILVAAAFATFGWLYTARRARSLSRKQHTINTILMAQFNKDFRDSMKSLKPLVREKKCPDLINDEDQETCENFRAALNHYEFVAVGIRNGDFDEQLFKDAERGTILQLFETCSEAIYRLRDKRERQSIYEHLEWLTKQAAMVAESMGAVLDDTEAGATA